MKQSKNTIKIKQLSFSALCLAIALLLPFLTGQIPQIGSMLSPMHLPVLICGFVCGWRWGLRVGLVAPLLRSLIFGMPHLFPTALAMSLELAAYGAIAGLLYMLLPKKNLNIYVALLAAMIAGRIVWGAAQTVFLQFGGQSFTMAMFIAGAITNAIPGMILQIILVPLVVMGLKKAKFILQ